LPTGLTLSSGGLLSGTVTVETETVYNFTIVAIDAELQDSPRSFSINITVGDPLFVSTTSLLRGVANTFVTDSSSNNFAVSVFGDTKPSNFSPYTPGYYSNFFDGTGDYLTATIPSFGTGDFTIEGWVYNTGNTSNVGVFHLSSSGFPSSITGLALAYFTNSAGWNLYYANGSQSNAGVNPVPNTWYHFAVTRSGTALRLYINGILTVSVTDSTNYSLTSMNIGGYYSTGFLLTGYISNLRVVNGAALYTAAFTPVTQPLTAVTNTSLLTCQSNRFIDNSTNNFAITRNGDVKITAFGPFVPSTEFSSRGSTYFNGTGDALTTTASSALAFGTGDFTVEFWLNFNSTTGRQDIIWWGLSASDRGGIVWNLTAGNLTYYISPTVANAINYAFTPAIGTWYHIALVRISGSTKLYVNGAQVGSTYSDSKNYASSSYLVTIGKDNSAASSYFNGYISNLRIVKGTAVYTAAFTPPAEPLTAIENTSLLTLQNNTANNNHQFLDDSSNKLILSRFGNATQGSFSPYSANGWSVFFSSAAGQARAIQTPATANNTSGTSSNFTLEAWAMKLGNSSLMTIAMISGTTTAFCRLSSNGSAGGLANWTTEQANHNTFAPIGTWFHVAACRHNGTLYTYINGVMVSSAANTTGYTFNGGTGSTLSQIGNYNNASNQEWIGYISNYRIVNGTALYPSGTTFTPSTSPLIAVPGTLLLTCQNNSIIDESPYATTLIPTGTVKPSVQPFAPFKAQVQTPVSYSGYFDGVGDYLTVPSNTNWAFSGQFTIEGWFYWNVTPAAGSVFGVQSSGGLTLYNDGTRITPNVFGSGNIFNSTFTTASVVLGKWYHIAVTRNASNLVTMWVDGVSVGSATASTTYTAGTYTVGPSSGTNVLQGDISNFRIVNGTAVYTANFTPPAAPLTAISGTSLLTCQNATFVDNSSNRFAITVVGNSRPVTLNPFGATSVNSTGYTATEYSGSMYFDGTGDYISSPSNVAIGTGSFTIEGWIYPTALGTQRAIIDNSYWQTGNNGGYRLYLTSANTIQLQASTGAFNTFPAVITSSTALPSENQWYHIAVVRNSSNSIMIYINGVAAATAVTYTASLNLGSGQTLKIGAIISDGGVFETFLGYISNVRILPGTAVYLSSFVPPQTPVELTADTILLLNGTNAAVADATTRNNLETVGGARLSVDVSKFSGTSSMYFGSGGSQYAQTTLDHPNFGFGTGNFTIEMWINPTPGVSYVFFDTRRQTENRINLGLTNNSAGLQVAVSSSIIISVTSGITPGSWNYVTVTRASGSLRMFINGIQVGSTATMTTDLGAVGSLCLGCAGDARGNTAYGYTGYIQDVRITRGVARYTTNFTPPAAPLQTK